MAIGLSDLKEKKKIPLISELEAEIETDKSQRPWVMKAKTTQSFSGNNAVKLAQEIVEKNNTLVHNIRLDFEGIKSIKENEKYILEREGQFEQLPPNFSRVERIKSSVGFFSKIKRALTIH